MKGYVRCMWQPKGCMAKGYAMELSMAFITKYIQNFWVVTQIEWGVEEEEGVKGEVLEGVSFRVDLNPTERDMAHHYVLTNITAMADWVKWTHSF